MSEQQNPYEQLGVTENSSFEEIQAAKKRICEENSNDAKVIEQIESAYDAVIMDRLRLRQEGKIKVPERIRFPERKVETKASIKPIEKSTPNWLQDLVDSPSQQEILIPTVVFLVFSGLVATTATLIPLLAGISFLATVYFITVKEKRFGRSLLISLGMLILGTVLGNVVAASLQDSGLAVASPEQISFIVTFVFYWLASCFLK